MPNSSAILLMWFGRNAEVGPILGQRPARSLRDALRRDARAAGSVRPRRVHVVDALREAWQRPPLVGLHGGAEAPIRRRVDEAAARGATGTVFNTPGHAAGSIALILDTDDSIARVTLNGCFAEGRGSPPHQTLPAEAPTATGAGRRMRIV